MADREILPVNVEGDWTISQSKTLKNKLQLYFQSKKKSGGGECRVEMEEESFRVYFQSEQVRDRVLAKQNHEIILDKKPVKLRLSLGTSGGPSKRSTDSSRVSDSSTDFKSGFTDQSSAQIKEDYTPNSAVVVENVTDVISRDLLMMLVESISGVDESDYSLEIIWESHKAVAIFNNPADAEKFVSLSQTHSKIQKHGLNTRPLEAAKSIWIQNLPPTVVKDMVELWLDQWAPQDNVVMIPKEQAATATFSDPKVVEKICTKEDHMMRSIPIKVYPYYDSLGTALYGTERPAWKMPDSFIESVHPIILKFLLIKNQLEIINDQMRLHFCSVDLNNSEAKLNPLPSFLRQSGLTAAVVENWSTSTQKAFRNFMSRYSAFECAASQEVWTSAENDVRLVVKEDAVLEFDAARSVLTVAGCADYIKQIRAPVENIVLKAMSAFERKTKSITENMSFSRSWYYIIIQEGLQKVAFDISSELNLFYDADTQMLAITGLPEEVYKTKTWILEKNMNMCKKQLNVPDGLRQYLTSVDPMDLSEKLFTSQGISAIYCIESHGVLLIGSSDRTLANAESKMKADLHVQTLKVEDQKVVDLPGWMDLTHKLLDTFNSSSKKTVAIYIHPERRDRVTVSGFVNPVKEACQSLQKFITSYSNVEETVCLDSCAVVQFIKEKKSENWMKLVKDNILFVKFDSGRPRIMIKGPRLHVHELKSCFQQLADALFSDTLTVDKPGAKKHVQSNENRFLSSIMTEFSCVVVLQSEVQDEMEEGNYEEETKSCYCEVTIGGVVVSVSKADICSLRVDAVVNAANEDLDHIGGLALALLKAAGPELQKISTDYVNNFGKLRPGDAITTSACNLPCKHVIHAVGPRFSNFDKKTSVSYLKMAVNESLKQAEISNCLTVALPAISSGVFGFPVPLCAETIAQAVREFCNSRQFLGILTEIHLVDNNSNTVRVLADAVNKEFIDFGPTMTVPPQVARMGATASGYQKGRGRGRSQSQPPRGTEFGSKGYRGRGAGNYHVPRRGQSNRGSGGQQEHEGTMGMEQTTPEGLKIVLVKGNIQDQTTNVIVNTIAHNMSLAQGVISKAILERAGDGLQSGLLFEAGTDVLEDGQVVITDGFRLRCQKVFHAVCPFWDNGKAERDFIHIIAYCLEEAEKQQMSTISFPAIGTGNLGFPRNVVSKLLLKEIHLFSRNKLPRHLRKVVVVVHPSDSQTVDCFTREFSGQTTSVNIQHEGGQDFHTGAAHQRARRPQSSSASASFSQVSSPNLGVYQMKMGQVTLEVSSGDITKETCDVIVNSSNQTFTLQAGVSQAILQSAGLAVLRECVAIVNSPGYTQTPMIMTSGGQLPCQNIIHIVGQKEPAEIKKIVYDVLKFCEENKFTSVAFPALGTGQGGADPSLVANAMVGAVVEFVRKKQPKFICKVKILIFQTTMITEFVKSMKARQGEDVEKSIFGKFKDTVTSFLGLGSEQLSNQDLNLEQEEFEPAVFELCAENQNAVNLAKNRILDLIVNEQQKKTIKDKYINQLSQVDMEELKTLQMEHTVRIRLDKGSNGQEPTIHIEGVTRDVYYVADKVNDIIRKVERTENEKEKALLVSGLVQWQYQGQKGKLVPFDILVNLTLEEALEDKRNVQIKIKNEDYVADPRKKTAISTKGSKQLELLRSDLKVSNNALPPHWDSMNGEIVKLFLVAKGSKEYTVVEKEVTQTGLAPNIISIERVQNETLWQSYQLLKKQMETKNNHTNNEMLLFHGTSAKSIDLINSKGFDRNYAGQHGTMFGKGTYFAVDPAYSAQGYAKPDTNGHKRMYLARVLVGDYTPGNPSLITPPPKSSSAADLFDSVSDSGRVPTMFVVFNDIQAYPEYLITFV